MTELNTKKPFFSTGIKIILLIIGILLFLVSLLMFVFQNGNKASNQHRQRGKLGEATTLLYGKVISHRRTVIRGRRKPTDIKGAKISIYEREREISFAITESDGYFEIKNVPIGTYNIFITHDKHFPLKIADVTIQAGKNTISNISNKSSNIYIRPIDMERIPRQIVVRFRDTSTNHERETLIKRLGVKQLKTVHKKLSIVLVEIPDDKNIVEMILSFMKCPIVLYAEPNGPGGRLGG